MPGNTFHRHSCNLFQEAVDWIRLEILAMLIRYQQKRSGSFFRMALRITESYSKTHTRIQKDWLRHKEHKYSHADIRGLTRTEAVRFRIPGFKSVLSLYLIPQRKMPETSKSKP